MGRGIRDGEAEQESTPKPLIHKRTAPWCGRCGPYYMHGRI